MATRGKAVSNTFPTTTQDQWALAVYSLMKHTSSVCEFCPWKGCVSYFVYEKGQKNESWVIANHFSNLTLNVKLRIWCTSYVCMVQVTSHTTGRKYGRSSKRKVPRMSEQVMYNQSTTKFLPSYLWIPSSVSN